MKLSLSSSFLMALFGLMLVTVSPVAAQATPAAPAAPKVKKIPFHGKLESVDASAQTITISGKTARVFHLTPETKITDGAGQPSSLSAAVAGEDVGGSYTKDATGTMTLFSVRFGAKVGSKAAAAEAATAAGPVTSAPAATTPPPAPAPAATETAPAAAAPAPSAATAKVKKQTFSGKVVSVDIIAHTLVVHGKADQTFTVPATAKFTGVDGLSSITAGQKVSGTYTKSADGATNTVATLKVK